MYTHSVSTHGYLYSTQKMYLRNGSWIRAKYKYSGFLCTRGSERVEVGIAHSALNVEWSDVRICIVIHRKIYIGSVLI